MSQASLKTDFARAVIWYDYFGVPQPSAAVAESDQHTDLSNDMGKAVNSIPAYVEAADHFIVLAPDVEPPDGSGRYLDYFTWKGRGWCRMERAARALSTHGDSMLLLDRESTIVVIGCQDLLYDPVGEGQFSVDADKERLQPVVRKPWGGNVGSGGAHSVQPLGCNLWGGSQRGGNVE